MRRSATKQPYRRPVYDTILGRAHEPRRFLQVLAGPRQVGKTTLARQVMDAVGVPAHMASADDPALRESGWLETQWEIGRLRARNGGRAGGLLVMDEIQKIPAWSESVKRLWDEDTAAALPLRVMLLGSAPLLVQKGLTESLAGRFELIRVSHWSFAEMRDAFGWTLEQYLYFGGYPGAADLISDEERWSRYLLDSLVETTAGPRRPAADARRQADPARVSSSAWAASGRATWFPTTACSDAWPMPATPRPWPIISSCSPDRGCSADCRNMARLRASVARAPSCWRSTRR